jgi:hypothetical protein
LRTIYGIIAAFSRRRLGNILKPSAKVAGLLTGIRSRDLPHSAIEG